MIAWRRSSAPVAGSLFSSLALGLSFVAGCAGSQRRTAPVVVTPPPAPAPACHARARLLAPSARTPRVAALAASDGGWALAWSERATTHEALRFLVVDAQGAPRSPSAEVADDAGTVGALAVAPQTDGYEIAWTQDDGGHARRVDAHGRPRTDVTRAAAAVRAPAATRCARAGDLLRCDGERRVLELPAGEQPLAESLDAGLAVIGLSGTEGLRLWVLDCR